MSIQHTTIHLAAAEYRLVHGESMMTRQRWLIADREAWGWNAAPQRRMLGRSEALHLEQLLSRDRLQIKLDLESSNPH